MAPRFAVKCTGDLASGSAVTEVVISDMSVTGCGVEIAAGSDDVPGRTGVLNIRTTEGPSAPVMLPVVISNHRVDGGKLRLGLKFRRLSVGQMRSLIGVMDGMIDK